MSEYTSDLREYVNPGRGETVPRQYSDPSTYNFIEHIGAIGHTGNTYGNGSSIGIKKGYIVNAKAGNTVFFYDDSKGQKQVGPAGGKGGQADNPSRSGMGTELEYVGVFTGNATNEYIEVDWINRWWQDASWKFYVPFATIKKGEYKTEAKTSWVKISAVTWSAVYVDPKNPIVPALEPDPAPGGGNAGIDTTTLGVIAIGAALFLKRKKKKK